MEASSVIIDLMHQAALKFQNNLFSESELLYRAILEKNPTNHQASLGIALAALQQKDMITAIQFMQQAAKIAPEIALYRRNLGELLRRTGQWEAAIASHLIAIRIEPHSAEN